MFVLELDFFFSFRSFIILFFICCFEDFGELDDGICERFIDLRLCEV